MRVLDVPPTDYQRFSLWGGAWNEAAGETIRYLDRPEAAEVGIPTDHDWWLFDDSQLVLMQFSAAGELVGREITTDPETLSVYRRWMELTLSNGRRAPDVAG